MRDLSPENHLFMSTGGTNFALDQFRKVRFPQKFESEAQAIQRRLVQLDSRLNLIADRLRRKQARKLDSRESLNMVEQGLLNTVHELEASVRKGGDMQAELHVATSLLADYQNLKQKVLDYTSQYHPVDWAVETMGALPNMLSNLNFAQMSRLAAQADATIEDVVYARIGDVLLLHEDDFYGVAMGWVRVGDRKTEWVRAFQNGSTWVPVSDPSRFGEEFIRITRLLGQGRRMTLYRPRVA